MVFLEKTITNPKLTLAEWAVLPPWFWNYFLALIEEVAKDHTINTHIPYGELSKKERDIVNGFRLGRESLSVFLAWKHIGQLVDMNIMDAQGFFKKLTLNSEQKMIADKVMKNISERLEFLQWVGLSYITLSRRANTLSGW